jgi:hypothetical protein
MVRVSIEVRNGAARLNVMVRAKSIRRALSIAGNRYPGSDVRVRFPIDPESFFVKDPAATEGPIVFEKRERIAA